MVELSAEWFVLFNSFNRLERFERLELQPRSYPKLFPNRVDVLLGFFIHDDGIGPFTLEALAAPFPGRVDPHLGTETHYGGGVVQHIHGSFNEDDIPFRIDVVAHDPRNFREVLYVDVMVHD